VRRAGKGECSWRRRRRRSADGLTARENLDDDHRAAAVRADEVGRPLSNCRTHPRSAQALAVALAATDVRGRAWRCGCSWRAGRSGVCGGSRWAARTTVPPQAQVGVSAPPSIDFLLPRYWIYVQYRLDGQADGNRTRRRVGRAVHAPAALAVANRGSSESRGGRSRALGRRDVSRQAARAGGDGMAEARLARRVIHPHGAAGKRARQRDAKRARVLNAFNTRSCDPEPSWRRTQAAFLTASNCADVCFLPTDRSATRTGKYFR
jgi:hypothetical protein